MSSTELARPIETWRGIKPHVAATQNEAALMYLITDAQHDILALALENDRLKRELDEAKGMQILSKHACELLQKKADQLEEQLQELRELPVTI